MARKVTDISQSVGSYVTLSKTPKNRSKENFFYKELQDKYNADWKYAPNVVEVEYETAVGNNEYATIEVRDQPMRNDKGMPHADDLRRLVFKDLWEKRFNVGSKFRFSARFDDPTEHKDIWLAINMKYSNPGTSVTVERCNHELGFYVKGEDGISRIYREPAILSDALTNVSMFFNETAIVPQAELTAIVQYNDRTRDFYINQRFVVGRDKIYRIKNLYKFDSEDISNPDSAGLIRLYLAFVETSQQDNFEDRIAYNEHDVVAPDDKTGVVEDVEYSIKWEAVNPTTILQNVPTSGITIKAVPYAGTEVSDKQVEISIDLENLDYEKLPVRYRVTYPDKESLVGAYVQKTVSDNGDITLVRQKAYLNGDLVVTAKIVDLDVTSSIKFHLANE